MKLLFLILANILAACFGDLPTLDYNTTWGATNETNDYSIRPFEITFEDEMIADLKMRLGYYRAPAPTLDGVKFHYGFNTNGIDSWLKYWANEYDFKAREKELNKYPQYKVRVQELDIHFIRVKPVNQTKRTVPLLLLHGWPGSVREFYEAIPLLTADSDDRDFGIEVIAPSLPGFAFSDAAIKPGMGVVEIAILFNNFMSILGYDWYCVQGGDWGTLIGTSLATLFPKRVGGFHTNLPMALTSKSFMLIAIGQFFPNLVVDSSVASRIYPLQRKGIGLLRETGYFHFQATKPDTLGVAMTDSPAGLLAYFLQCMSSATRANNTGVEDGGLLEYYTRDQLLDNLMLYWANNKITTSSRLYYETMHSEPAIDVLSYPTDVPFWALQAPDEILYMTPDMLKTKFTNFLNATVLDEGGHFLALEKPAVFSSDVLQAVKQFVLYNETKSVA